MKIYDLSHINRGLFSVYAAWSSHSIIHKSAICNLLEQSTEKDFEIEMVSIDEIGVEQQIELFGAPYSGYFESIRLEHGEVIMKYVDNNKSDELQGFLNFLKDKL